MTAEVELDAMLRRLHMPTVRRLWSDLQVRAEKEGMRYADYLQTLVGEEVAHRTQTRISRMTHRARFPFLRTIEEFDFTFQSGLRKELLGSYLGPEFVPEGRNLLLYGPSGVGKTHVAIAIAYKAIQNGSDARFVTAAQLIDELSSASRDGRLREALVPYTHPGVLVVDEVGYLSHGPDAANVLFQVVNERHLHRRPMVFTTNKPVEEWGTSAARPGPGGGDPGPGAGARAGAPLQGTVVPHPTSSIAGWVNNFGKRGARVSGTHRRECDEDFEGWSALDPLSWLIGIRDSPLDYP